MDKTQNKSAAALRACFKSTLPVMAGYFFLGITYGILMRTSGLPWWLAMLQAAILYTGSMEFLMVAILTSAFHPISAAVTALMVGARHLFYGLAMLPKYSGTGWKKPYLIFATSDETFAINYAAQIPDGIDAGWYYFWVSLLDQLYWVAGSAIGGIFGGLLKFNTEGLDFMMTAMFTVIFMDQWLKDAEKVKHYRKSDCDRDPSVTADAVPAPLKESHGGKRLPFRGGGPRSGGGVLRRRFFQHLPSVIGIAASVVCLLIFGADHFIVPTMVLILVLLALVRPVLDTPTDESEAAS